MPRYFLCVQGLHFLFSPITCWKCNSVMPAIQSLYTFCTVHLAPWSLITTLTLISRGPSKKDFSCWNFFENIWRKFSEQKGKLAGNLGRKEVKMMQGFLFLWKCRASPAALSPRNWGETLEFSYGYILIGKKKGNFYSREDPFNSRSSASFN